MKLNLQEHKTGNYQFEIQGNTCRIWMPDSLAGADAVPLTAFLEKVRGAHPEVRRLVCDFEQTRFMDGMGLSALVTGHKLMQQQQGQLILDRIPSQVELILTLTGLNQVFHTRTAIASDIDFEPSFQKELVAC